MQIMQSIDHREKPKLEMISPLKSFLRQTSPSSHQHHWTVSLIIIKIHKKIVLCLNALLQADIQKYSRFPSSLLSSTLCFSILPLPYPHLLSLPSLLLYIHLLLGDLLHLCSGFPWSPFHLRHVCFRTYRLWKTWP